MRISEYARAIGNWLGRMRPHKKSLAIGGQD